MLTFSHALITILACAAPGDADVRPALRAMLTEGWEIGAFHKAWKQVETLGESRQSDAAALAIAIIEMRHNQFDEANKVLSGLAARSQDPVVFAALAWTEAAKAQHTDALQTLERAARSLGGKKPSLQADVVFRAAGAYFGYLECQDVGKEVRAQYRLTRGRVLALASEEQQTMMARLQAGVEQRMGKVAGEEDLPTDPAALEAARAKAVAEVDRKLASLTGDYQKHARQAALLAEQVKGLQAERNKHLDNPNGQAYRELNQAAIARAAQQRESEAKAAQVAQTARDLTQYRKSVVRRFDELIEKTKIVGTPKPEVKDPTAPPAHEALTRSCQFPLDLARQAVLRSILPADDAKAVNLEFRVWTDRKGAMMFVAQMLRIDVDRVVLRNPASKEASVSLATLSHADQDYIDSTSAATALDLASIPSKPEGTDPKLPNPMPASPEKPIDVTPKTTTASLFNVKVISATIGAGDTKKDITELIRAHIANDPFAPVQMDVRTMSDPTPNQKKFVEIAIEVDGKPDKVIIQDTTATLPDLPDDGLPLASASKDLRILAARYGAGLTWIDCTHLIQQRLWHPGEPVLWSHLNWDDPWPGVPKWIVVWFDYGGKRYTKTIRQGELKPLVEGIVPPKREPFTAVMRKDKWLNSPKPARLASNDRAFGVMTEILGHFTGYAEEVSLTLASDQTWQIDGHASSHLQAHAMTITTPLREKFVKKPDEYSWKPGSKPVKMISSTEGFCVLSSVSGRFAGLGDAIWVTIDPKDGFWYLDGRAGSGAVSAKAFAYRLKPNAGIKVRCAEYWSQGREQKILEKDQGFCFISGFTGNMQGFGNQARVVLTEDGHWDLHAWYTYSRGFTVRFESP